MSTASAPASPPNTSAGSNAPTLPPTSNGGDNAPSPSPAPPTSNVPTVRTSRPSPSPSPEPQPQPSPSPPPPPSPSPPPPPPPPPPSPSPDPPPPPPPPPPSPSPNPRPTAASPPPPPPPPEPAPSPAPPPPPNPSPNPPPEIPAPPQPQSQSPPIPPSDPANNPPSRETAFSDAPINQQVHQQGEVSSSFAASNAAIDGAAAATTTARDSMPTTTDVSSTLVSPAASLESISGVVSRSAARTSTTGPGKFTGTITAFNASSTVDFGGTISGPDANGAGVSIGVVFAIVAGCVAAAALLVTLAVWWIRRDNNKTGSGGGTHKQGAISGRKDMVSSVVFWSKWNKNEKPEMQQPFLVADGGGAAAAVDENASSTLAVPPPPLLPIESLKEVEHVVVGNSVLGQIEEEDEDEDEEEKEEKEDAGLMEVAPLSATESFASTNPLASQDTSRPLTEQQPQPQPQVVASEAITTEVSKKPMLDNIPQPVLAASSASPKIATLSVAADTPRTRRKLLGFLPRITAPRKQSATEISPSAKVQATATTTTTTATTSSAAISRAYQMHRPQPTIHQTPADAAATAAAALPSNLVPPAAYEQFQQDLALQYMYGLTNEQQQQLHQHQQQQQQQHQYFSQYQMMHQTAPELSGMSQEYINSWWQAFYQQNPVLAQEYYEAALKAQREGRL
ncbi:hypothetical protein HDU80_006365 [Chytriomyces hyalinus]|nr:hypothetical protein HDU80_006365 [Chytriomyces hyalinus]